MAPSKPKSRVAKLKPPVGKRKDDDQRVRKKAGGYKGKSVDGYTRPCLAPCADQSRFGAVPTVTLYVGPEEIPFQVHRDLLCNTSQFFNSAFTGDFEEGQTQSMRLPEDDAEMFEEILQLLYTKTYDILLFGNNDNDQDGYMRMAKLYVALDKYRMIRLKNDLVDEWCKIQKQEVQIPDMPLIKYVFANTLAKSKLREAVIADYVWCMHFDWFCQDDTDEWFCKCPEFTVAFAIAMTHRAAGKKPNPFDLGCRHFHEPVPEP